MRKQLYLSLALAALFLFACQPQVTFTEPQPKDVAALSGFPQRIQGKYLSSEDSSLLLITASSMIRIYDFDQKLHLSQLDSTKQIIGDSLFDMKTNEGQFIRIEGDSIVMHINDIDTLFTVDKQNVLKKYMGYYFININISPDNWEVKKLGFSRGKLTISDIRQKEDMVQLKLLTETSQDTLTYVFSPSRRQFKKFVRNEGFRDSEVFLKAGK